MNWNTLTGRQRTAIARWRLSSPSWGVAETAWLMEQVDYDYNEAVRLSWARGYTAEKASDAVRGVDHTTDEEARCPTTF